MTANLVRVGALVAVGAAILWFVAFGSFEQEVRLSAPGGYPLPEARLPVLNEGLFEGDSVFAETEAFGGTRRDHLVVGPRGVSRASPSSPRSWHSKRSSGTTGSWSWGCCTGIGRIERWSGCGTGMGNTSTP